MEKVRSAAINVNWTTRRAGRRNASRLPAWREVRSVRSQEAASACLSFSSASFDNDVRKTSGSKRRIRSVTLSPVAWIT